ncbi:ABC transporter permease [Streptomyces sp. NPDC046928]|uniref:ABC transporter permease subunit n=1 Tax=Streptomyces sp. NPDC046928 TaxID=3155021 RepID=UPI00340D1E0B
MTAVTLETTAAADRRRGPRGLLWATLRVHRSALWFWVMLVAVGAGVLLWAYGPGADAAWAEYRSRGCLDGRPQLGCDMAGDAAGLYHSATALAGGLIGLVPFLTAAWAGAALIGRELESGTARLAWTQSVSPARWLAAKLAVPAALLVAGMLVLTLLHRLLFGSDGALRTTIGAADWYQSPAYEANGTLATAYALLGLAVGALAGLLLRRAVPALGTAVLALGALTIVLGDLRPYLWPVTTQTGEEYPEWTGMVVDDGALTSGGARVSDPLCVDDARCLAEHDIVGYYRDFHPASHFWPLHLVETGIVLALAALAVLVSFRLLNRRTARAV